MEVNKGYITIKLRANVKSNYWKKKYDIKLSIKTVILNYF